MTTKEELQQSQVAELLRRNNQLLAAIHEQGRERSSSEAIAEIKRVEPEAFKEARLEKIRQSSLADILDVEANEEGFSGEDAVDDYLASHGFNKVIGPKAIDKENAEK